MKILKKSISILMVTLFVGSMLASCASTRGGKKTDDKPGDKTEASVLKPESRI